MPRDEKYIVVRLYDERANRSNIAKEIVHNLDDVEYAYPAYDDGFGRLVMDGDQWVNPNGPPNYDD